MSCGKCCPSGATPQAMVDQRPKFERTVFSRKAKIYRPDKRKKKVRWI